MINTILDGMWPYRYAVGVAKIPIRSISAPASAAVSSRGKHEAEKTAGT